MGSDGRIAREPDGEPGARIGRWMIALAWVLALGLGTLLAGDWLERREAARAPRAHVSAAGLAGIELVADRLGHYRVVGRANGEPVEFLVDTGASTVALSERTARRLGLVPGRRVSVETASGPATARATTLGRLEIGPLAREGIAASIVPGMREGTALLGMSFLRGFELVQRDGKLLIREPAAPS